MVRKQRAPGRGITVAEAVDEALCYGWIDSRLHPLDGERSALRFTPRRPRSIWSARNKARVEDLTARGRMAEAGLRAVATAKRNGSWTALDAVERLEVPADLASELAGAPAAASRFEGLPPSAKKLALWWIAQARRPATRRQRIAATVRRFAAA